MFLNGVSFFTGCLHDAFTAFIHSIFQYGHGGSANSLENIAVTNKNNNYGNEPEPCLTYLLKDL